MDRNREKWTERTIKQHKRTKTDRNRQKLTTRNDTNRQK